MPSSGINCRHYRSLQWHSKQAELNISIMEVLYEIYGKTIMISSEALCLASKRFNISKVGVILISCIATILYVTPVKGQGLKLYRTYVIDTVIIRENKSRVSATCITPGEGITAVVNIKMLRTANKSIRVPHVKDLTCETALVNNSSASRTQAAKITWLDRRIIHRSGRFEIPYAGEAVFRGDQSAKATLFHLRIRKMSEKHSAALTMCNGSDSLIDTSLVGFIDTSKGVGQFVLESTDIEKIIYDHVYYLSLDMPAAKTDPSYTLTAYIYVEDADGNDLHDDQITHIGNSYGIVKIQPDGPVRYNDFYKFMIKGGKPLSEFRFRAELKYTKLIKGGITKTFFIKKHRSQGFKLLDPVQLKK